MFIEGVEVNFVLSITNLKTSTTLTEETVQEQHYVFTPDRNDLCVLNKTEYGIQVTAINLAGNSPPAVTNVTLFPLPDMSPSCISTTDSSKYNSHS